MLRYTIVEKKTKTFLEGAAQQLEDRIIAGETARFMGLSDKTFSSSSSKSP